MCLTKSPVSKREAWKWSRRDAERGTWWHVQELNEVMAAHQELLAQAEDARAMAAFFEACPEPQSPHPLFARLGKGWERCWCRGFRSSPLALFEEKHCLCLVCLMKAGNALRF
jgi:hypothetical protein